MVTNAYSFSTCFVKSRFCRFFVFYFVFFAPVLEKLHPVRYKMFWRAIVQTVTYAAVAAHFVVLLESVILLTTLFFLGY